MNTPLLQLKLYKHVLMEHSALPAMPGPLVYVFAANGVFLWARRDGLEALIPVAECDVRGLYPVTPFVRLDGAKVPSDLVEFMVQKALQTRVERGEMGLECLFYLFYPDYAAGDRRSWQVMMPSQIQTSVSVRPVLEELDPLVYANTLMEVHSHPHTAFYSGTDDSGENGFRLYGVIGFPEPGEGEQEAPAEIRMRVSIFGMYWEIPPAWVLDLPEGLVAAGCLHEEDRVEKGGMHEETAS